MLLEIVDGVDSANLGVAVGGNVLPLIVEKPLAVAPRPALAGAHSTDTHVLALPEKPGTLAPSPAISFPVAKRLTARCNSNKIHE